VGGWSLALGGTPGGARSAGFELCLDLVTGRTDSDQVGDVVAITARPLADLASAHFATRVTELAHATIPSEHRRPASTPIGRQASAAITPRPRLAMMLRARRKVRTPGHRAHRRRTNHQPTPSKTTASASAAGANADNLRTKLQRCSPAVKHSLLTGHVVDRGVVT